MPAFIDLTGRQYGKWTVLRRDTAETRPGAWWVCCCDPARGGCGRLKTVQGWLLRGGESTQCRACSGKGKANRKPVYKVGDRVGRWTIKGAPRKADGLYPCVCECGGVGLVQVGNLRNGTSTQCQSCRSAAVEAKKRGEPPV